MGVHQSIGMKGNVLFGSDAQKERFLPDLCSGRKLAGFALTETSAGSDAFNVQSRAVKNADGSWTLNGEKRWIGNGGRGSVLVAYVAMSALKPLGDELKVLGDVDLRDPIGSLGAVASYAFGRVRRVSAAEVRHPRAPGAVELGGAGRRPGQAEHVA